ncbi:MAG: hypothetical protein JOZ65_00265 [Chloroflexi bacterium]|nr:hypothetical protein [Chloroflexota bacterium]
MNTDDLRRAYAEFVHAAQQKRFAPPYPGEWSAELVLAHVIVGDRLIAEAAGRIMAGVPTSFDNLASQSEPYLQSIVDAAGDWDGLVSSVRQCGDELIALAGRVTDEQAATPIACKIVSDNSVVIDATVPLSNLVRAPVDSHLRMHAQQLAALSPENTHAQASTA